MRARLLNFGGAEQDGVLEEAAEFFFADVTVRALAGGEVLEGLVFHLEALEMNDLEVKFAGIPNLALLQFHGRETPAEHPLPRAGEKGISSALLLGGLFGGDFLFSLLIGAVGHGLFLGRLFLVRFGGFVTHDFMAFDFELTGRRHESFSAGDGMVPAGGGIVNDATAPSGGRQGVSNPPGTPFRAANGLRIDGGRVKGASVRGCFLAGKMLGRSHFGRLRQNSCKKSIAIPRKGGMVERSVR